MGRPLTHRHRDGFGWASVCGNRRYDRNESALPVWRQFCLSNFCQRERDGCYSTSSFFPSVISRQLPFGQSVSFLLLMLQQHLCLFTFHRHCNACPVNEFFNGVRILFGSWNFRYPPSL